MPYLTPYTIVTPPAVVQGVRRLPAVDYDAPGAPVTDIRLEALRKVPGPPVRNGYAPIVGRTPHTDIVGRVQPPLCGGGQPPPCGGMAQGNVAYGTAKAGARARNHGESANPAARAAPVRGAPTLRWAMQRRALARVYFATDSTRLTAAARMRLEALPARACYTVVGHADPRPVGAHGSYRLNLALSARRALAVARVLDSRGSHTTVEARSWLGAAPNRAQYRLDRRATVFLSARHRNCLRGNQLRAKLEIKIRRRRIR